MLAAPQLKACSTNASPNPQVLKGWVGGEKGFDTLGVTDALPVYWVREAELKRSLVRIRRKLKASLLTASSISARRQLLSLH